MSIDKTNPAGTSDDQTGGRAESLESAEIEDINLETVSGGGHLSPTEQRLTTIP